MTAPLLRISTLSMMKLLLNVKLSQELLLMLLVHMKHLQNMLLLQIMPITNLLLLTTLKRLIMGMRHQHLFQPLSQKLPSLTTSNTMALALALWVSTERKQQQFQLTAICHLLKEEEVADLEVVEDANNKVDVVEGETKGDLPKEGDSSEDKV